RERPHRILAPHRSSLPRGAPPESPTCSGGRWRSPSRASWRRSGMSPTSQPPISLVANLGRPHFPPPGGGLIEELFQSRPLSMVFPPCRVPGGGGRRILL